MEEMSAAFAAASNLPYGPPPRDKRIWGGK
jgi:hypothetical protein